MAGDDDDKPEPNREVNAVSLKLQPFWPNSPATWFISAEAQFTLSRITSDISRYHYVVASLPQDVAESIMDILQNPPVINLYSQLKKVLIERHSLSMERRIRKLVSDEDIGDKKPSEFYRTLKALATGGEAETTVSEDLILKLWLNRLPQVVNIALIPHKSEGAEKLQNVADQVWEALQNSNVSVVDRSNGCSSGKNPFSSSNDSRQDVDRVERLEREISELKNMISGMNFGRDENRSRSQNRSGYRGRSRSRSKFNASGKLCWYHFRYGDRATKCTTPCGYVAKRSNDQNPMSDSTN